MVILGFTPRCQDEFSVEEVQETDYHVFVLKDTEKYLREIKFPFRCCHTHDIISIWIGWGNSSNRKDCGEARSSGINADRVLACLHSCLAETRLLESKKKRKEKRKKKRAAAMLQFNCLT